VHLWGGGGEGLLLFIYLGETKKKYFREMGKTITKTFLIPRTALSETKSVIREYVNAKGLFLPF
jgi:hypothetical protein